MKSYQLSLMHIQQAIQRVSDQPTNKDLATLVYEKFYKKPEEIQRKITSEKERLTLLERHDLIFRM